MDPQATFVKRFGDLVALLRSDPGNDAAQDLALTAASAALVHGPIRVEAGIETSAILQEAGLKARLLARRVDAVCIDPDADVVEVLALARALAHDTMPLPASDHIEIITNPVPDTPQPPPTPPTPSGPESATQHQRRSTDRRIGSDRRSTLRSHWPGVERRRSGDRRRVGERRLHLVRDVRAESARLYDGLVRASSASAWEEVLYATLGLIRIAPRLPQADRRSFLIQVRRLLQRPAIEAMIDLAEREPDARPPAVEVLSWVGLDAAEAMLDRLRAASVLGPRGFLLEALGRMPQASGLVVPLLRSTHPHEIRYGALLAAQFDRSEAAPLLGAHISHPNEEVRVAVVHALGNLHRAQVAEALRAALQHPSPRTRAAAAAAIATWRAGALGVVLGAALEIERDPAAWHALLDALGRTGSASAYTMLAAIALTRRSLFHRRGYTRDQRLAAMAALARAQTPITYGTLRRLSSDADREIRTAAQQALGRYNQAAAS